MRRGRVAGQTLQRDQGLLHREASDTIATSLQVPEDQVVKMRKQVAGVKRKSEASRPVCTARMNHTLLSHLILSQLSP